MAILLTCGTGRTASRIARVLQERQISFVLCSRKGQAGLPSGCTGVVFDWFDQSTYVNPFNLDTAIERVYLIPPPAHPNAVRMVTDFMALCLEHGVQRIVLMSALIIEKGRSGWGEIHEHLVNLGVDYCVLKPSWFFENLRDTLAPSIRDEDTIVTCTGDEGCVGMVSLDDVAETAIKCLTDETSHNCDHIIVGPQLLSYDKVAEQLTEVLKRKISHKKLSMDERIRELVAKGLDEEFASRMACVEGRFIAAGNESRLYTCPDKVVGKVYLRDFIEKHKDVWLVRKTDPQSPLQVHV